MKPMQLIVGGLALSMALSLQGVEYGGEKSYLVEARYQVCVIPPQIDDAIAKGVKVVTVNQAKALYDQQAHFFDARDVRHFRKAHITGAHPVTFDRSKADYLAVELPKAKDVPIVFYCYGESCANSYEAALAVRQSGYTNVNWLLNGFGKWQHQGYPVSTVK